MRILALMPDPYGGFGGIAQYNRDLFDALCASSEVESILSLTRHRPDSDIEIPKKLSERFLPGSELRYLAAAVMTGLKMRTDVVLCGHVNLLPVAALLKRLTGSKLILEAYGFEIWQRLPGMRSWGTHDVDLVISISRYTREQLIRWSGLEPRKIKIVPNAVHLDRYAQTEKPRSLVERYGVEGKRVLLTVGRLPGHERYKGQDRIISLLPKLTARFPNLIYLIVGDGEDRLRLEALTVKLGLQDQVVFAGRIPEEEKIDHYNLADAFAMPSTSEGFGFVFLEAAACGVPVLGGRVDGSRDALVDGRLGVMVDPESPDELLSGLEEVLARGKQVPDSLVPFDFPRFTKQIEDLIEEVSGYSSERQVSDCKLGKAN
jgi:phosphatidyl-myo-inositol dimannoside synthase